MITLRQKIVYKIIEAAWYLTVSSDWRGHDVMFIGLQPKWYGIMKNNTTPFVFQNGSISPRYVESSINVIFLDNPHHPNGRIRKLDYVG